MLWDPAAGLVSLAGLVVAVTPQVVFVGSSLNGSSLEVAASCALFATLLRIAQSPGGSPRPRSAWVVAGLSAILLTLSRSPRPVWVVLRLALWALVTGRSRLLELLRIERRPAIGFVAMTAVGIALSRLWERQYGPDVELSLLPPGESVKAGARALADAANELVGRFGFLETGLAPWAVIAWGCARSWRRTSSCGAGTRTASTAPSTPTTR